VQVLRGPLLLARFACFLPQPTHQLLGKMGPVCLADREP
jgi:hypothetical protein